MEESTSETGDRVKKLCTAQKYLAGTQYNWLTKATSTHKECFLQK